MTTIFCSETFLILTKIYQENVNTVKSVFMSNFRKIILYYSNPNYPERKN
jgi:hypothetical protein